MPPMSAAFNFAARMTFFTLLTEAAHQSTGFCSDQPGFGLYSGYSTVADARIAPSSFIARVLVPLVPISMPRKTAMRLCFKTE